MYPSSSPLREKLAEIALVLWVAAVFGLYLWQFRGMVEAIGRLLFAS